MGNRAGYSLITVLVATAIASVLLASVLFIVDLVSTSISRNAAADNIEAAVRTVQGLVTNRDLCDNALRMNNAATRVPFNPSTAVQSEHDIQRIYLQKQNNEAGATIVLSQGGSMGVGYRVERMFVRERVPNGGRGTIQLEGIDMNTFAAEIVIQFSGPRGSGLQQRTIPLNAVVHPGADTILNTPDDVIYRCYQDSSVQYLCEQLGGTYANGNCDNVLSETNVDCKKHLKALGPPDDCSPPPAGIICDQIYYVVGFTLDGSDVNAKPICRCQTVCRPESSGPYVPDKGSVTSSPGPGPGTPTASVPSTGGGN